MRIADIECIPVQSGARTFVPVLVTTDTGLVGVGEAGLQRRWRAVAGAIDHLRDWLVGEDPFRIEHLWQRMWRGGFYPADRTIGSAVSAIDIALWDIKAQALGVPVYELLGGLVRDHVECFFPATTPIATTDADARASLAALQLRDDESSLRELVRRLVADGHRYYRTAPRAVDGRFEADAATGRLVRELEIVRDEAGAAMQLMVDLHGRLSPAQSIEFLRRVEPLGMFVVEDPIRSEHPATYRSIRSRTSVPLAAGEQWVGKWDFAEAVEHELVDYIRPDLCIVGGLTEGRKVAALAETHHIDVLAHNPLGPVCTAASLQFSFAVANAGPQEIQFAPHENLPEVFSFDVRFDGNRALPPTSPGLGVRFDRDAARAFPPRFTEPPHYRRADGSYTNY